MENRYSSNEQKIGFFKDLLNRRVPQIVGFYLGGGWGIIQFMEWIVGRYLLSPLLVDLALTIVIALLPSIVIVAYCHGRPGKNRWRTTEKVFIPVNLILACVLVFLLFQHKDLDSIASRVKVTDESGKEIEKVVPKQSSIKELALFYFDNRSNDKELNWLKSGFTTLLELDLGQDPFVNTLSPALNDPIRGFFIHRKFRNAGIDDISKAPLMLQKKVANELNADYFISGNYGKKNDAIEVTLSIYRTKNRKTVATKTFHGKNPLLLIDDISLFVKKSFDLPSVRNDDIIDLQLKDFYTHSIEAAKLVSEAVDLIVEKNDWKGAEKKCEAAIKIDKTFTLAYLSLSEIYALNNKPKAWKGMYKYIMKYLYKLPEKSQMQIKAGYYMVIKGKPEKSVAIFEMLTKLYPNDVKNYLVLAGRFFITGEYEKALPLYRRVLEMNPSRVEIYKMIGDAYQRLGKLKDARKAFQRYVDHFPKKVDGVLKLGNMAETSGDFEEAKRFYEKALLLEPDNSETTLEIARLNIKSGDFKGALGRYMEILPTIDDPRKKAAVLESIADYYGMTGQKKKQLHYTEEMLKTYETTIAPLAASILRVIKVDSYLENGQEEEIKRMLDALKTQMSMPFDKILSVGYIKYHIHRKEPEKALSHIPTVEAFVKATGIKQYLGLIERLRGKILRIQKSYEKALEVYENFLKTSSANQSAIYGKAICLLNLKRFDEALEPIKQLLKKSPFNPTYQFTAAKIRFGLKQQADGIRNLKTAIKGWKDADADYKPASEARALLETMKKEGADVQ